jgi:hypothetical protein
LENTRSSGLNGESFELAVDLACAAFRKIENPSLLEGWPQCELLIPHIQSLTQRQNMSNTAKTALFLTNHLRGKYLKSRGRFVEAESLFGTVIADMEQLFSPDDLDTLVLRHGLALVYRDRGRYVDVEMLMKRSS